MVKLVLANVRPVNAGSVKADLVDIVCEAGAITAIVPAGSAPTGGERIDAQGRWVIPGLWDRHVHMNQWAMARRRFDVSAATSAQHAAELTGAAVGQFDAGSGRPLTGFGYRDGLWPDAPLKGVLDAVVGPIPTVLVASDLHSAWLNSAALALYGFAETCDGVVREGDCFDLLRRLGDVPTSILDAWVADASGEAAARGVVGVVDMEMAWSPGEWLRRAAVGTVPFRVDVAVYEQDVDRAIAAGWSSGDALIADRALPAALTSSTDLLRMGPLKVIADGSLNTRTAYCFEPYGAVGTEHRGVLNLTPDGLADVMTRAADAGIRCAIHAIGDNANAVVLDAFAATGATGSIEHAQLLRAADMQRMAALGIEASIQPQHAVDDRWVTDEYWADRVGDAFRMRSLIDAGVRLRLGSDAPVAPLDPWVAIGAAVARALPGDVPWQPSESLSVIEAIAASTNSGRTTLRPGDDADLVLLDVDPHECDPAALASMPVAATLVAGEFVFSVL